MKLLIKQKVFSWSDSYNVYDEDGEIKYTVKAEVFSLTHKCHVYDRYGNEVGLVHQHLIALMPTFDIEIGGRPCGTIHKKLSFLKPKYEISYHGWTVQGDFLAWKFDVFDHGRVIMQIDKQFFHWNDTYVIDIENPENELLGLMLVIAIDAANCESNNN